MSRIKLFQDTSTLDVSQVRILRESLAIKRFNECFVICINDQMFDITPEAFQYLKGEDGSSPTYVFTSSVEKNKSLPSGYLPEEIAFVSEHDKDYWELTPFFLDAILVDNLDRHFMVNNTTSPEYAPHTRTKKANLTDWLCPHTVTLVDGQYYNFLRVTCIKSINKVGETEELKLYYNETCYNVVRKPKDILYCMLLFSCGRLSVLIGASSLSLLKKWITDYEKALEEQPENKHLLFELFDSTCTKWLNALSIKHEFNSETDTVITSILNDMKKAYKDFKEMMYSKKAKKPAENEAKLEEITSIITHFFAKVKTIRFDLHNVIEHGFANNLGNFDMPPKEVTDMLFSIINFKTGIKNDKIHELTCEINDKTWKDTVQAAREKNIFLPEGHKKVAKKFKNDSGLLYLFKDIYIMRSKASDSRHQAEITFKHIEIIRKESLELIEQLYIDTEVCINKIYHAVRHPVNGKNMMFDYKTVYASFKQLSDDEKKDLLCVFKWDKDQFKGFLCSLQNIQRSCLDKYIPITYEFTIPWTFGIDYTLLLGDKFAAVYNTHSNLLNSNRRALLLYIYHVLNRL